MNNFDKPFQEVNPFSIHRLDGSTTSYLFTNEEINIQGSKLLIIYDTPECVNHKIRINDRQGNSMPCRHGIKYTFPFNKIYFTGTVVGRIYFIAFKNPEYDIDLFSDVPYGTDFANYAATTTVYPARRMRGIWITGAGNLVVNNDISGIGAWNRTFSGLVANIFVPISAMEIVSTSTVNGIIIYETPNSFWV